MGRDGIEELKKVPDKQRSKTLPLMQQASTDLGCQHKHRLSAPQDN